MRCAAYQDSVELAEVQGKSTIIFNCTKISALDLFLPN